MQFRYINIRNLKSDLRKLAIACLVGGLTGIFLDPHHKFFAFSSLVILGLVFWYLGLKNIRRKK